MPIKITCDNCNKDLGELEVDGVFLTNAPRKGIDADGHVDAGGRFCISYFRNYKLALSPERGQNGHKTFVVCSKACAQAKYPCLAGADISTSKPSRS